MRAIYLENIELSNEIILTDEKFHHLIKVLRLKRDYEILVLDGIGNSRVYKLNEINKKSCVIASSSEAITGQRCSTPDVLICPPKKEYAEAMIRSCIEAGVNNIYFAESEYSQWSFENNKRIVYLSGEAFFDVAKDKAKPFSVITKGISTTALGTSFNVKAYADDPLVKVLLMTGKVGVEYLSAKSNGLILNPGMGAEYDSNKGDLMSKDFDFEKEMGWKQSRRLELQRKVSKRIFRKCTVNDGACKRV